MSTELPVYNNKLPVATTEQQLILDHKANRKVVIAVPGAGKTTLLLQSIKSNESCLFLSFSKKCRADNQAKVKQYLPLQFPVEVHTLDSFCFNVVAKHQELAGYKNSLQFDNDFDEKLLSTLYAASDLKTIDYDILIKVLKLSLAGHTLSKSIKQFGVDYANYKAIQSLRGQYLTSRRTAGFISYGEQIKSCLQLFKNHQELMASVTAQFDLLLVDELQDLNKDRMDIVILLAKGIKKSMVVGDDAQSIFKFAGAEDNNFTRILKLGAVQFELTQTHRCTIPVASLASFVRGNIRGVTQIKMWSAKEGQKVKLRGFDSPHKQYDYVAESILSLAKRGVSFNDVVVLARHHECLQKVQEQLIKQGVAYHTRYSERESLNDDSDSSVNCSDDYIRPFVDIFCDILSLVHYGYDHDCALRVLVFFDISACDQSFVYVESELLCKRQEGKKTNIEGLKLLGNLFAKTRRSRSLESKANSIVEYIVNYFKGNEKYYMVFGLKVICLISKQASTVEELLSLAGKRVSDDDGIVSLRTAHVSKGLEFRHVFLVDADTNYFPYIHSKNSHDTENDELKLFYVAITRSIESLTICSVQNDQLNFTRFLTNKSIKPFVHYKKNSCSL